MKKTIKAILFLAVLITFTGSTFGQHNIVDPTFNLQVQSSVYGVKWVNAIQVLPDGKLLALGSFNTYNGVPVAKLVRLHANGSLDTTFNNQTVIAVNAMETQSRIFIQPNGKIVLKCGGLVAGNQGPKPMLRVNADGTFDPTFNFTVGVVGTTVMDSLGRIYVQTGGSQVIRLNDDGSVDNSFNFTPAPAGANLENIVAQGNKLIVLTDLSNNRRIYRLNDNGAEDMSFTPFIGTNFLNLIAAQPDNKIFYQVYPNLFRLNENGGGNDATFQPIDTSQTGNLLKLTNNGKIVLTSLSSAGSFHRYLSNGAVDPSFTPYSATGFASYTIQADEGIVIGDGLPFQPSGANNFVRLTPGGTPDPTFNQGGTGFQNVQPGIIQAIETYPDGRVLLAGKFDVINSVPRIRLARLNADSTVDATFQVNTTSGTGDYFSNLREVYQVRAQSDGKIVVSGWFDYVLGGVTKQNIVRLNSNGSIDGTFNLTHPIPDYSQILLAGQNRFAIYSDGKLMVGNSKSGSVQVPGPIKLTEGGARDAGFNPTLNGTSDSLYYDDVVIQPDGKILASGSYTTPANAFKSFVARFNTNGTADATFPYVEETGRLKSRLVLLPSGKIVVAKYTQGGGAARVLRLNSDGSPDNSFTTVSTFGGSPKLNALLVLPNGKIFVGGQFTITVNGQQARNLLQLDDDGGFESTIYNLNEEVFCLALDSEGRVLVGGGFTVIGANGAGATRAYVARLTDSELFDYDGDGKADISVFRPSENKWYVLRSSNGQVDQPVFAIAGDVPVPADYDGDGKTDVAIFRPSNGQWWYKSSIDGSQNAATFGMSGDIPRPSDFDGDGKADFVLFRPSSSTWLRFGSTVRAVPDTVFGIPGDQPLVGDFDGEGKSDLAIFRPSSGDWWYAASSAGGAFRAVHWGQNGDIPVPADYDGDGKTDNAVFRPSDGGWYIYNSSNASFTILAFGTNGDRPVAADYDGDGKADIAVYRPSTGIWYLLQTTSGSAAARWGIATDTPTEGAFIP